MHAIQNFNIFFNPCATKILGVYKCIQKSPKWERVYLSRLSGVVNFGLGFF